MITGTAINGFIDRNGVKHPVSGGGSPIDISGKADKVEDATEGNFASLDENGNLQDSGKKASDFATSNHNHNDSYVSKSDLVLPEGGMALPIAECVKITDANDPLNLDTLISHDGGATPVYPGVAHICMENCIDGSSGQDWSTLLFSEAEYPIHVNSHGAATFDEGEFVMLTVYRLDKGHSEHEHDVCYFVTIDGIFDSGNNE